MGITTVLAKSIQEYERHANLQFLNWDVLKQTLNATFG